MKYLFIDTSTSFFTLSILTDNEVLYNHYVESRNDVASKIIPTLDQALTELNLEIEDIDKIFVVNGPGSFTGVRIGVTVAKTIAWAKNIPIVPISSLEFIATTNTEKQFLVPMIDARRGNVFAGIYDKELNIVKKDQLINLELLLTETNDNYEFVTYDIKTEGNIFPKPNVLKLVQKHKNDININPHNINPKYLKLTEAEENKKNNIND